MGKLVINNNDDYDILNRLYKVEKTKSNLVDMTDINYYLLDNSSSFTVTKANKILNDLASRFGLNSEADGVFKLTNGNTYIGTIKFLYLKEGLYLSSLIHSYDGKIYYFLKNPTLENVQVYDISLNRLL